MRNRVEVFDHDLCCSVLQRGAYTEVVHPIMKQCVTVIYTFIYIYKYTCKYIYIYICIYKYMYLVNNEAVCYSVLQCD